MVKNKRKNISQDDPLGLQGIIELIEASDLPEYKKIAYLYMIADGSFSIQTLADMEKEMADISADLEKKIKNVEEEEDKKIAELKKKVKALDEKIGDLAIAAAEEARDNAEKIITYAIKYGEERREDGKDEKIKELRKKILQKNP